MALYSIDEAGGSLREIPETTLSGEGKRERHDLQRWLRDNPAVLEDGLFGSPRSSVSGLTAAGASTSWRSTSAGASSWSS